LANTYPVKISFQAVDQVTARVRDISSKIKGITQPLRDQGKAFSELGESLMLDKIGQGIGNIKSAIGNLLGSLARVGFVAGGAFAGLFAVVNTFAKSGADIKDAADRIGIGTKSLQELTYAAKLQGIESEDLQTSLKFLNKNLVEAAKGGGEAGKVFSALGIRTKDANGRLRTIDDLLPEIADKFKNIKSGALKTSLAMAIFGKSGDKMSLLLQDGAAGIQALRDEANQVGAVISEDDIKSAAAFDDLMDRVKFTLLGVRNTIGAALLPVFSDMASSFMAFFRENQAVIREFAVALGEGLRSLLPMLASGLRSVTEWMRWFSGLSADEKANAISTAFKALLAVALLPTAAALGSLVLSISQLGLLFGGLIGAIPIWAKMFSFLGITLNTLSALVMGAGRALMTLALNPVGLTIMAIAGAVYLLYTNWESFLGLLKSSWAFIQEYWSKLKDLVGLGGTEVGVNTTTQGPVLGGQETLQARLQGEQASRDVNMNVAFANMPRGTQVATQNSSGVNMDLSMGYAMTGF